MCHPSSHDHGLAHITGFIQIKAIPSQRIQRGVVRMCVCASVLRQDEGNRNLKLTA